MEMKGLELLALIAYRLCLIFLLGLPSRGKIKKKKDVLEIQPLIQLLHLSPESFASGLYVEKTNELYHKLSQQLTINSLHNYFLTIAQCCLADKSM